MLAKQLWFALAGECLMISGFVLAPGYRNVHLMDRTRVVMVARLAHVCMAQLPQIENFRHCSSQPPM